MLGYLLGAGLKGVGLVAAVVLILGLVALIRCRREDTPASMRALGSWWRREGHRLRPLRHERPMSRGADHELLTLQDP